MACMINLLFCVAGTTEDKVRMFIIYYLMTADMSEVGVGLAG